MSRPRWLPAALSPSLRAAVLTLAVLMLAACAGDDSTTAAGPSSTAAASATTVPPPSTTSTTEAPEPEEYAVGRVDRELVDPSRPTAADPARGLPDRPDRTMPVIVLYPAEGDPAPDGTPVVGAPPDGDAFPLVVFSHGVTAHGGAYIGRLQHWAKAGYTVVAPTFPLSSGAGGLIGDYVNQPDDVHFVIEQLHAAAADPSDELHGTIDPEKVAVAGHSLGAITTIGAAFNSCCAVDGTDAAVEIAGIELPFPSGSYDDWPDTPLLAIHGALDGTVPVSGSDNLVQKSESPTHYLRYTDAGHSDLLAVESGELLDRVVIAFFDRYLKGEPDALDDIEDEVEASGLATYEERNTSA